MSSLTFGQKIFQPKPPIQGSFPLDHEGECKQQMLDYMLCMAKSNNDNTKCKQLAGEYLKCRMDRNLMDKRDLDTFGYKDSDDAQKNQKKQEKK